MLGQVTDAIAFPEGPIPERRREALVAHGDERDDHWYWLRGRDDPAVLAHLEAENNYLETVMAPTRGLQEEIYQGIVARVQETDLSVPVRKGQWWYYSRTVEGQGYAIHCRRPAGSEDNEAPAPPTSEAPAPPTSGAPVPPTGGAPVGEEILLDENELAKGHEYFALGTFELSPCQRYLAYAFDTHGNEHFQLRVRDLATTSDLPDVLHDTCAGAAWLGGDRGGSASDSLCLLYTRPDEIERPYQLWSHDLGSDPSDDSLIYQEDDERFYLGVGRTRDEEVLVFELHSKITSECWVHDAWRRDGEWHCVEPRRHGVEYSVEHHPLPPESLLAAIEGLTGSESAAPPIPETPVPSAGEASTGIAGTLLIVTNDKEPDFTCMIAPAGTPGALHWRVLIPHDPATRLEAVEPFAGHLLVSERNAGETRLRVLPLRPEEPTEGAPTAAFVIPVPDHPSTVFSGMNPEFTATRVRYEHTSLASPRSVHDYDLVTGKDTLLKTLPVLGGFDATHYRTERHWARADDGTMIPISLVYRADRPAGVPGPALIYGYGAYEISIDPIFSIPRLELLDRGILFAIAHVRGGGELGRSWYESGKLLSKKNTFSDFIACASYLIDEGFTTHDAIVARGGSAGGLLMGAVANLAPELFRGIVAEVPFVDCLTTIMDESLPLTVIEWEEWGNPKSDPEAYAYIKSYSPYDNISDTRYPLVFTTAGLNDPRVGFWEPAKWVAKLRSANAMNRAILRVELGAGHHGPSGRYEAWRDEALVQAFILLALGLAPQGAEIPPPGHPISTK